MTDRLDDANVRVYEGSRTMCEDEDHESGPVAVVPAERKRPRYRLDDLLDRCHPDRPRSPAEQEWLDAPAVGLEQI